MTRRQRRIVFVTPIILAPVAFMIVGEGATGFVAIGVVVALVGFGLFVRAGGI